MDDPTAGLAVALGAAPPASIAALPEPVLTRLVHQVQGERRHQAEVVERSVRTAVKGVPLPVRGIVRKALTS